MWAFLSRRKRFWLVPLAIVISLVVALILSQGGTVSPFKYATY